jgi:hypothetical protein
MSAHEHPGQMSQSFITQMQLFNHSFFTVVPVQLDSALLRKRTSNFIQISFYLRKS